MTAMPPITTSSLPPLPPFWSAVFDASYNGIIVIDREGTIALYNSAARRIFGEDHTAYVGRHISDIRTGVWPDMQEIMRSGKSQIGLKLVLGDTTIIANRSPIFVDGQVQGLISVFQDISEYETITSELQSFQRLNHELEAIIESSYDGLYITDGQANTIRVNHSYERITGLKRQQLIGRNMNDLVRERIFDHSVTLEVLKKQQQVTILQQIKGDKQVMVTGTPIYDPSGGITFVVTNVRDITELNDLRGKLETSERITSRYYQTLKEHDGIEHALQDMVIKSQRMMQVVRQATKVADSETSVLLLGESGVGKSMLARLIHQISHRKDRPFVKINCGTIPGSLMESELFGYEKGAFTGAVTAGKAGLIEAGDTGTVFLDEITEIRPDLQVKLLEIIEEKTFTRVGGNRPQRVDVRILAATNRNLQEMMRQGDFRQDLYYRLNVIPIAIPPLRERQEDIPALALNVLETFNRSHHSSKRLEPKVIDALKRYHYPGNVRELINIMERMMLLSDGDQLTLEDLPEEIHARTCGLPDLRTEGHALKDSVQALEAQMIRRALEQSDSLSEAAGRLQVHPTTLWRKMNRYAISADDAKLQ
jgi:PAS domain S-box-containing protein